MKPNEARIKTHIENMHKGIGEVFINKLSDENIEKISSLVSEYGDDEIFDIWAAFLISVNRYKAQLNDPRYKQ
jgi:hypothetical protein